MPERMTDAELNKLALIRKALASDIRVLQQEKAALVEALTRLLELVEANAPDGYYTENPAIIRARKVLEEVK